MFMSCSRAAGVCEYTMSMCAGRTKWGWQVKVGGVVGKVWEMVRRGVCVEGMEGQVGSNQCLWAGRVGENKPNVVGRQVLACKAGSGKAGAGGVGNAGMGVANGNCRQGAREACTWHQVGCRVEETDPSRPT